jgi:hypothetical protein
MTNSMQNRHIKFLTQLSCKQGYTRISLTKALAQFCVIAQTPHAEDPLFVIILHKVKSQ